MPHELTSHQKQLRVQFCRNSLARFAEGRPRRVLDIVTGDESWFYLYDPTTKEQSKEWVSKTDARPTKVRRNRSAGKRMVAIFFMKSGLIESIPLESGTSVTGEWYINDCLPQVFDAILRTQRRADLCKLILHDDNARPHRAWITTEFLVEHHVESYPNPPYSPDLSPCDFFIFPKLKNQLRGIRFNDDDDMLEALDEEIRGLTKEDFKNCFNDWFSRMNKCIDAHGEYFEKIN